MKNYTKYGPTGMLWALYLIVGVVAYFVSNLYFKFEIKDAIIFGVVNLVAVIIITEGIDWIFKKARLRKERKATEKQNVEETPVDEAVAVAEDATDDKIESEADSVKTDEELSFKENLNSHLDSALIVGEIRESTETVVEPSEAVSSVADEALPEATENVIGEKESEVSDKPRGRRANPEAVIDAPTSSMAIIAPDMFLPKAESVVQETVAEPVVEETHVESVVEEQPTPVIEVAPVVEEPVVEESYLSADEFLASTKLTSPRAIVREYQRLGGKDDIYAVLMERQK